MREFRIRFRILLELFDSSSAPSIVREVIYIGSLEESLTGKQSGCRPSLGLESTWWLKSALDPDNGVAAIVSMRQKYLGSDPVPQMEGPQASPPPLPQLGSFNPSNKYRVGITVLTASSHWR